MNDRRPFPLARTELAIALGLAMLAIVLRLIPGLRIIDDAYITYRYARNLVRGIGLVYNPGEAVLGTTTPFYALLLALIAWPAGVEHLPTISVVVNALADGFSVALLYVMARRLLGSHVPAAVLGVLWAVAPGSVTFAVGGMETSVFIALTLGTWAAWLAGHTMLAAALTAFATLTRPDALIWAGPLALGMIGWSWAREKERSPFLRLPWVELGVFLTIALPWAIFATLTYGSPLTHSVAAKSVAYHLPPTQALTVLIQDFSTPFFEFNTFGPWGAMVGAILYPLLALLGGLFLFHTDRRSLALTIYPWVFALVYAVANPLMFRWYSTPPLLPYILSIIAGVWGLAERTVGAARGRWAMVVAGILWSATSLNAWVLHPDHGPDRPAPEMAWFKLELIYEQAGRSLAPLVDEHTVIAAGDIGAIGWYSDARILDTLGLVSPQSVAYYPIDPSMLGDMPYAVAPDLILDQQPDYIVILETYGRNGLLKDPRFEQLYRLREMIDTDVYNSQGMLIFERNDLAEE